MSERQFTLRVRLGAYEIEISGTREEVFQTLENLPAIVDKVSRSFRGVAPPTIANVPAEVSVIQAAGPPYPPVSAPKGCCDAILQLLASNWGKERPRTLREIVEALKANALHYPLSTVGKSLQRLVERCRLRRWKEKEGYVYVPA